MLDQFLTLSNRYMDFVEISHVLLDSSSIYFPCLNGCKASFVSSCYSVLECYDLFFWSQVEYRSFLVIFIHGCHHNQKSMFRGRM